MKTHQRTLEVFTTEANNYTIENKSKVATNAKTSTYSTREQHQRTLHVDNNQMTLHVDKKQRTQHVTTNRRTLQMKTNQIKIE